MNAVRSFLLIRPAVGTVGDVVEYYREHRVLEAALPFGVVEGEILHPRVRPVDLLVTSVWSAAERYEEWVAAPQRAGLLDGLAPVLGPGGILRGWTGPISDRTGPYNPGEDLVTAHRVGVPGRL